MTNPLKIVLIAATFSLVSACLTTSVVDPRACPREEVFTKAEQARLAAEFRKSGPAMRAAIRDYGKLRDKARACRGERVPR
jgi:hypothetical protein